MPEEPNDDHVLTFEKRIRYYGAADVVGISADLAIVSHATGEFTLYFYQVQMPETDDPEAIRQLEELTARCVSRIVLSPSIIDKFYEALGSNIQKRKKLLEMQESKAVKDSE